MKGQKVLMQQRYKNGMESTRPAAGTDANITVTGLTVDRYLELKQAEKQLRDLTKRIAACATVNTDAIAVKERAYRNLSRHYTARGLNEGIKQTDQERKELEKLYEEWTNEKESPRVTIDGNKVTKLILEYAACGMDEQERERYGFDDGLPDSAKVKIE